MGQGESGIEGRTIKRKPRDGGKKKKGKRKAGVREYMGHEWTEEEEDSFEVEAIVGKVIADGMTVYGNQGKAKAGTILYRIIWKDAEGCCFPPDVVWYEPSKNLDAELPALVEYEARMAEEAVVAAAEAAEQTELDGLEEEESMPPP